MVRAPQALFRRLSTLTLILALLGAARAESNETSGASLNLHFVQKGSSTLSDGALESEYVPLPGCNLPPPQPFYLKFCLSFGQVSVLSVLFKPNLTPNAVEEWPGRLITYALAIYQIGMVPVSFASTAYTFVSKLGPFNSWWDGYQCFGMMWIEGAWLFTALTALVQVYRLTNVIDALQPEKLEKRKLLDEVKNLSWSLWSAKEQSISYGGGSTFNDREEENEERMKKTKTRLVELGMLENDVERLHIKSELSHAEKHVAASPDLATKFKGLIDEYKSRLAALDAEVGLLDSPLLAPPKQKQQVGGSVVKESQNCACLSSIPAITMNEHKLLISRILYKCTLAPFALISLPYVLTHIIPGILVFCIDIVPVLILGASFSCYFLGRCGFLKGWNPEQASHIAPEAVASQATWMSLAALPCVFALVTSTQLAMTQMVYLYSGLSWSRVIIVALTERQLSVYAKNFTAQIIGKFNNLVGLLIQAT